MDGFSDGLEADERGLSALVLTAAGHRLERIAEKLTVHVSRTSLIRLAVISSPDIFPLDLAEGHLILFA